jgi:hypothetical protein
MSSEISETVQNIDDNADCSQRSADQDLVRQATCCVKNCQNPIFDDNERCIYHQTVLRIQKRFREAKRAHGICLTCPGNKLDGRAYCAQCRARKNSATRDRQLRLRAQGLCPSCSSKVREEGKSYCHECLEKSNRRQREKRAAAHDGGICAARWCRKKPYAETPLCEKHFFKDTDQWTPAQRRKRKEKNNERSRLELSRIYTVDSFQD